MNKDTREVSLLFHCAKCGEPMGALRAPSANDIRAKLKESPFAALAGIIPAGANVVAAIAPLLDFECARCYVTAEDYNILQELQNGSEKEGNKEVAQVVSCGAVETWTRRHCSREAGHDGFHDYTR